MNVLKTEKVLTLESVREFINDIRAQGYSTHLVFVSEYDKRELKQELMQMGESINETDEDVIGFIQGCMLLSHKDVPRGTARVVIPEQKTRIYGSVH